MESKQYAYELLYKASSLENEARVKSNFKSASDLKYQSRLLRIQSEKMFNKIGRKKESNIVDSYCEFIS